MSRDMQISEMGLKLIKAYEGYRPVDRELVTGQRVVGYGHRLYDADPVYLSRDAAEDLLRQDLAPFVDMLNENVHAPLSQSQFDALCSLSYNIGPKAFLQSDTLRALNNGRPLDAANGFDIWRKSEIDGKTYVVDALMRRRTAEKALFLRTENGKVVSASAADLPPVEDQALALLSTEDALPIFSQDDANGVVATAPYDANPDDFALGRRREDGPAGGLAYSEAPWYDEDEAGYEAEADVEDTLELGLNDEIEDTDEDLTEAATKRASTLIATTASELSEKLDSLIDDANGRELNEDAAEWPESLIKAETPDAAADQRPANIVPFDRRKTDIAMSEFEAAPDMTPTAEFTPPVEYTQAETKPDLVIDDLAADDAMREGANSAAKYIEISHAEPEARGAGWGYWLTLFAGFGLLGASLAAFLRGVEGWLQGWGPLLTFVGLITGAVLVVAALFYAIRASLTRS